MLWFLAQSVAPVSSATGVAGITASLDWTHLAVLAIPVAVYLAKILVQRIAGTTQKAKLAKLFVQIASEASDEHDHGTAWAGAVLDRCEKHSPELLAFAQDLLPSGLGGQDTPPPGGPSGLGGGTVTVTGGGS